MSLVKIQKYPNYVKAPAECPYRGTDAYILTGLGLFGGKYTIVLKLVYSPGPGCKQALLSPVPG